MDREYDTPVSPYAMWIYASREMRGECDPNEWVVLSFILERTYGWNKQWDYISPKQFLEGVWKDGKLVTAKTGLSRTPLYRALSGLHSKSLIYKRQKHERATPEYSVNHAWIAVDREQFNTIACTAGGTTLYPTGDTTVSNTYNNTRVSVRPRESVSECNIGNVTMPNPMDAVRAAAAAATDKTHSARGKRITKMNATALFKIWEDAWRITYPDDRMFAWRKQDLAGIKRAVERGVPDAQVKDFITFCVTDYVNVIRTKLTWAKERSSLPSPGFVIRYVDKFYEAYQQHIDPNREVRKRIASAPEKVIVKEKVTVDPALVEENKRLKLELAKHKREESAARTVRLKRYAKRDETRQEAPGSPFVKWD